jgi:hypothetical protein
MSKEIKMKTDKVIDGVLIKATQPKAGKPYVWPKGVTKIGAWAFGSWNSFNQPFSIPEGVTEIGEYAFYRWDAFSQPNSRRAVATNDWLRIDNWVFAGCYSGKLEQLRKRLDSLKSTPEREKAWEIISKPFSC